MDKICLKCPHLIKEDANFCEKCGTKQKVWENNNIRKEFEKKIDTIRYLTKVTQADFDLLKKVANETKGWKETIATTFYDLQFSKPETAAVFKKGERPMREMTMSNWYLDLFKIDDDEFFWKMQVRIAFFHVKRKVYNEFMISGGTLLQGLFLTNAVKTFGEEKGVALSMAFNRILDTVIAITAALYDKIIREVTQVSQEDIDSMVVNGIDAIETAYLNG